MDQGASFKDAVDLVVICTKPWRQGDCTQILCMLCLNSKLHFFVIDILSLAKLRARELVTHLVVRYLL